MIWKLRFLFYRYLFFAIFCSFFATSQQIFWGYFCFNYHELFHSKSFWDIFDLPLKIIYVLLRCTLPIHVPLRCNYLSMCRYGVHYWTFHGKSLGDILSSYRIFRLILSGMSIMIFSSFSFFKSFKGAILVECFLD